MNSRLCVVLALPFLAAALAAVEPTPLAPASGESLKQINLALEKRGLPPLPAEALFPDAPIGGAFLGLVAGSGSLTGAESPTEFRVRPALAPADADKHPLDDASVAAARGLNVEQLRGIRAERLISNREILTLNSPRLARFLSRLEKPKQAPGDYFRYRNSFLVDETGTIPEGAIERAFEQARRMPLNPKLLPAAPDASRGAPETDGFQSNSWTWKGPGNIGGRIRALLVHPTNPQLLWIGSAGGGIWKSTNAGASWSPVEDFLPNLAVCALAFDPTNASVMYAGTGEIAPSGDAIRGVGIFRSADGGNTWTKLLATGTSDFAFIGRLAVSANGGTILAATKAGILRSTDGGATWTKTYTASSYGMCHVAFQPGSSARAVASGYQNQVRYTTDGGATWLAAGGAPPSGGNYGRVECAFSVSSPSILYAVNDSAGGLWKSTDGGTTFAKVTVSGNASFSSGSQGWYDLLCWVDPTDPNRLIVGGVDCFRSTDGGANFTNITNVYSGGSTHPDQHLVVADSGYDGTTNRRIYLTNDGGVTRNEDLLTAAPGTGWTTLNNNLGVTQFYAAAGAATAGGMLIGGTQDNGTLRLLAGADTGTWGLVIRGDGGYAAVDQTNESFVYGERQYLDLQRSTDGGASFTAYFSGITGSADFIAPFLLHPANQNTLLCGTTQLCRSTDARSGAAFTSIKGITNGATISAIGGAPSSEDVIWVGYAPGGGVWNTTNGTATTPTWMQRGSGTLPSRRVTRFAVDPTNPQRVAVTYGGFLGGDNQSSRTPDNIWLTTNGGTSWTNIHGNLPPAPIYTVAMEPTNPQVLYVGTDAGIYVSETGGGTWAGTNLGPSTAPVVELFRRGTELVAVTHGRGIFTTDTAAPSVTITPDRTVTNSAPVRYRFTFSEAVTGFSAAGVSVTNGTKGNFTAESSSVYTLDVTPTGGALADIGVSIAAGAAQNGAGRPVPAASVGRVNYDATSPFLNRTDFGDFTPPTGWTTVGSWQWGTPTGAGPGGDHTVGANGSCYGTTLSGNYPPNENAYLTTPTFDLPALGAAGAYKLRFWMWMNAEAGQDGGNLEISTDGGASWAVVPSSALSVPYNGASVAALGGPGWTGTAFAAWTRVRLDLSAYAGQHVRFRFRFASDGAVNFPGWYIDDFALEQDPVLALSPAVQAVTEGNTATVSLQLAPRAPGPLSVPLGTSGTAPGGSYTLSPGTVPVAAGAGTASVAVAPVQDGNNSPRTQTVILTLAGGGEYTVGAANMATVVLLGNSGFDLWRAANFSPAQLTDPAVSGPNATPAGDGVSNILKFALGLSPFVPSAAFLPVSETVIVNGFPYLRIRITRPAGLANITYQGEVSGDLLAWASSSTAVETTVTTGPGAGQQTVTYRDRMPIGVDPGGLKRFLRLRVTIP